MDIMVKYTGAEPVTATWTKDKKPLTGTEPYQVTNDKGTANIHIPEVDMPDAGEWRVVIKNEFGQTSSLASLNVRGKRLNFIPG